MDDTLKRLLAAEKAASDLVDKAQAESEQLVQTALHDARQQEARFEDRVPELHSSFLDKSDQQAQQTVAEMDRRYQERLGNLRESAGANEDTALEAAFARLLGRDNTVAP